MFARRAFLELESMKITIETIPHNEQRYPTVGDWQIATNGDINIKVSQMSDPRYEQLVGLHELVEVLLCVERGISATDVDHFDKNFELHRQSGDESEPGDHKDSPYREEHFFATNVEALMSVELGVNFQDYEAEINKL